MTSVSALFLTFGRIGLLSFGGPAAQIALMHRELVEGRGWLTEREYLDALAFCMLLPGPEAMQLATYSGWKLRGVPGGLIAGGLFVLPGALVIAGLALAYAAYGTRPDAAAALLGVQAAVIVIVVQALRKLAGKALKGPLMWAVAAVSFAAIFAFHVPFPVLVLGFGIMGWLTAPAPTNDPVPWPRRGTSATTVALWLSLWLAPLALLWMTEQTLLFDLAAFFAKLAVVTFGGAYAVLSYMAQEVVQTRGWLTAAQMVDALGLAETTPGPLILVTQFVAMVTGAQTGGAGLALAAGAITLWMTFVPCFLWIFAGAPYVTALTSRSRPKAALALISSAVVGVILNLSIWFAIHVLFQTVDETSTGLLKLPVPDWTSLDLRACALTGLAVLLLVVLKRGMIQSLAVMAAAGWLVHMV